MQEWIFLNPDGDPWLDDQQMRKGAWVPTLERAEVRYRHPYMMRHTYASMMVSAGENMTYVFELNGDTFSGNLTIPYFPIVNWPSFNFNEKGWTAKTMIHFLRMGYFDLYGKQYCHVITESYY